MKYKTHFAIALSMSLFVEGCDNDDKATGQDKGGSETTIDFTLVGSLGNQAVGDVLVIGDTAYLTGGNRVVTIVDITDRTGPQLVGALATSGSESPTALDVSGDFAFVAAESDGLMVVDISAADSPFVATKLYGSYAKDVVVEGTYAYVADQDFGLRVINVSSPTSPSLAGSCSGDGPFGVDVQGSFAYCADNDGGFCIVDISNPSTPNEVGRFPDLYSPRQIAVQGNYAYVQTDTALVVFDISNSSEPVSVGSYTVECSHVAVEGGVAYVSTGYRRSLCALDVSNPSKIRMLDSIGVTTMPYGMTVEGDYLYVAASEQFLIYKK